MQSFCTIIMYFYTCSVSGKLTVGSFDLSLFANFQTPILYIKMITDLN